MEENIHKLNNQETVLVSFDKIDAKTNDILYFDNLKVIGKDSYLNGFHDFDTIQVNPDELRILLFTSGTTGNAKGVCLSHKNIVSNIMSTFGIVKVKRSDLFFSIFSAKYVPSI